MTELVIGEERFAAKFCRPSAKGNPIMKLAGVDDRESAARLTGQLVTVAKNETVPLGEGEYYAFDIVGLAVFDSAGNEPKILAAMDERQISYKKLKKMLGLKGGSVSLKMRGKQNFTVQQIAKLVEIFNKPAKYLMTRASD